MRLFALLGSLLVIGLIAALVVPPYVDWNQYRDRFEQEASRLLGQRVEVQGETKVSLLPLPSVTFSDIRVGKTDDAAPLLIAKSFKMNIELAPLLKGDVVVVDMALEEPRFDLRVNKNGEIDWPSFERKEGLGFSVSEASLDNFVINNGLIRYRDARSEREIILNNVDVVASAKTLTGPWRGNASLSYEDERFQISGSSRVWQSGKKNGGRVRLELTVQPQNSAYDFEIDGPVIIDNSIPSFKGRFRVKPGNKQNDQELISFRRGNLDKALPIRIEADLEMTSSEAVIPAFKLDIGSRQDPYIVTGSGRVELGEAVSFQVRAEGQQVNVERISGKNVQSGGAGFNDRIDALRSVLKRVPRFGVEGEISLYLPAIVAGDTVIRDVGVDLRPSRDGTGWQLTNFEAQLPGRTDMRANGKLNLGNEFSYEGELIVASKQPSGLATWLGAEVDAAVRELSRVGFSARTKLSAKTAQFDDLEISLGGRTLRGNLRRDTPAQGRPKLTAKLSGEGVDFDQLIALANLFSGQNKTSIAGHDLILDLEAERMTGFGVEASQVVAKLAFENSRLSIEQVKIADIAGAAVSLSGVLEDFPAKSTGNLKGEVTAKNAVGILRLLHKSKPDWNFLKTFIDDPVVVENTQLSFELNGQGVGYSAAIKGDVGGSDVSFDLKGKSADLAKPLGQQNIETRLILVNDDAARLLLQMGLPVIPLASSGRGALRIKAVGVPEKGMKTDAALTLRDGYVSVSGVVSNRIAGLSGSLNVVSEAQDLDPFILLSGIGFPNFGEGHVGKLSGNLKFDGDSYSLKNLKGKIGGASLLGNLTLDASAKPRPLISGDIDVSPLDMPSVAGFVFTNTTGVENGAPRPILSGLDAAIALTSNRVILPAGMNEVTAVNSKIILRDGDITFDEIVGKWAKGTLKGALSFAQIRDAQLLNGQLELKGAALKQVAAIAGFSDALSGNIDVVGTFESAAKENTSLLSELTGSGNIKLSKGMIKNFNGKAFPILLAAADKIKDEALIERAGELLEKNFYVGSMAVEDTEIAFNIGAGVLRANEVRLRNKNVIASGNGKLNFLSGIAELGGRVTFDAGKEAVIGAAPEFLFQYSGRPGSMKIKSDVGLLGTFLALRSSDRRQRDFEAQQSEILERQRLQRTTRLYALKANAKKIIAEENARVEQIKLDLERKQQLLIEKQQQQKREAEEAEKKKAIEEENKRADEDAARLLAKQAAENLKNRQEIESFTIPAESFESLGPELN